MPAVFISHSSKDGDQASLVKSWLNELSFDDIFLDLDKSGGIRAGESWEHRLYAEIARCHAVILVLTPAWQQSKWCFAEFSMARSLGKVIFPVIWPGVDPSVIGPELGSIQIEQWDEEGKSHLTERLSSVAHEIARGHKFQSGRPPYPGFLAFEPEDAAIFFGRDPEIRKITERLEARRSQGGARLLLVVGPSGSGKSSVVKAGVLPWLSRDSRRWIVLPPFRPGDEPLSRLGKVFAESFATCANSATLFQQPEQTPYEVLRGLADKLLVGPSHDAALLITIDQFEEIFTLADEVQLSEFLLLLTDIANGPAPIMLLATVRSDLMGEILKSPKLSIPQEVFTVGPLPIERLSKVIEGPAMVAAIQLEEGLTQRILSDAANADALPLLAFTLREMNDRFGGDGQLTILSYEALGDPGNSLSPLENSIRLKAEDTIISAAMTSTQLAALKEAFVGSLARVNDQGVRLRRPAPYHELPAPSLPIIEQLINARLLSARGEGEYRFVEVAHEALFRAWPQLANWLDEEHDFLIGCRNIEESMEIWNETPHQDKPKALLSGLLLERARKWQNEHPARLSNVSEFVGLSINADDDVISHARRKQKILTLSAAAAALVFAILGGVSMLQWSRAEEAAKLAAEQAANAQLSELSASDARKQAERQFAVALGAVASGLVSDDPRLALYLAGEAISRMAVDRPGVDARHAMLTARMNISTDSPHVLGSPISVGDALSISMAPDGQYVAIGDRNGHLQIISRTTAVPTQAKLKAHSGGIEDIEFNNTGELLASAGSNGDIRLWQISNGEIVAGEVLVDFGDIAWSVDFDQAGTQLAASSESGEIRIWEIGSSMPVTKVRLQLDKDILSVQFSPDGKFLIAGSGQGIIYGWDILSGEPLFPPLREIHTSDIWQLKFAPSGDSFATMSSDGSAAVVNFPSGELNYVLLGVDQNIQSVVYSNSNGVLIGGGKDGRLRWRANGPNAIVAQSAIGHTDRIIEIDASENGRLVASLGRDQNLRFWSIFDPIPHSITGHTQSAARGVAFSQSGSIVAAGDNSGVVYLWRQNFATVQQLIGHKSQVWAVAISPGSDFLASADRDGEIRLWSVISGDFKQIQGASDAAIWWLGFTSDGSKLIATGDDGVSIFDTTSPRSPLVRLQTDSHLTSGAISADGARLATTTNDGIVTLFDLSDFRQIKQFRVGEDILWNSSFNRDGTVLAVAAADETVSFWDTSKGQKIAELGGHSGGATDLAFLSGGATLVVADRKGRLHFWDTATSRLLVKPIDAHNGAIWRLEGDVDGKFVTTAEDGSVKVWDILDREKACQIGAPAFDSQRRAEFFGRNHGELACNAAGDRN